MSLTGCATGRAEDTTTARSYRTSYVERERLYLRQEFYLGRRAFKLNSTVTNQGPLDRIKYLPTPDWASSLTQITYCIACSDDACIVCDLLVAVVGN